MALFLHQIGLSAYFFLALSFVSTVDTTETVVAAPSIHFQKRPVVLLVGDSITEQATDPGKDGWVTLLQYRYTRSADILVRAVSGYNTRWFLKHAMPVINDEIKTSSSPPLLITIWLGVNDEVLMTGSNPEKHVPIRNYTQNLVNIIHSFRESTLDAKILLITPPHVDDAARKKYAEERTDTKRGLIDRSNAMAGKYAQACIEAGCISGVPVLNLYSYFNAMPEAKRNALLGDGLHFNSAGHKVVYKQLREAIENQFPEVALKLESWQIPAVSKWEVEDP